MRRPGKLKALTIARSKTPGMYGDGGGLYLQVSGAGAKSWIFRYWVPEVDKSTGDVARDPATNKINGTSREMGLGSATVVCLDEARELAADCRRLRQQGIDPIEARRDAKKRAALDNAKALTFKDAAAAYIAAHRAGWRNEKHAAQWTATLQTYAYPVFGDASVQAIDTALVMKVLDPIWSTKTETAGRVRGRIEVILDWATVRGFRSGENPARWRGHLDKLLPARSKVRKVKHHAALAYAEIGGFMAELRTRDSVSARALEFTILTAARTGESLGARWSEIDMAKEVWIVPAERMKGGREHRVPLCDAALAALMRMKAARQGDIVFPGANSGRPLSNMALLELLRGMERGRLTTHGFRSTFRDWAAELTSFPSEVVEMALAHAVGDKVEAAYRRGDLFDKRRRLMDAWSQFCADARPATGAVVPMRRGAVAGAGA
jgi:integrase